MFVGEHSSMLALASLTTFLLATMARVTLAILLLTLIACRRSAPRYRYDLLISTCWLSLLPIAILNYRVAFTL